MRGALNWGIMRRYKLSELNCKDGAHILRGIVPGKYLSKGGLSFKRPGQRTHDIGCACKSCDGKGRHAHPDEAEVFVILQGKGRMEVDGVVHQVGAGDVIVCEAGEDHHLTADEADPCVNLFLHASDSRHPDQNSAGS